MGWTTGESSPDAEARDFPRFRNVQAGSSAQPVATAGARRLGAYSLHLVLEFSICGAIFVPPWCPCTAVFALRRFPQDMCCNAQCRGMSTQYWDLLCWNVTYAFGSEEINVRVLRAIRNLKFEMILNMCCWNVWNSCGFMLKLLVLTRLRRWKQRFTACWSVCAWNYVTRFSY